MNTSNQICPCKDCTERTPTCHGDCKAYLKWHRHSARYHQAIVFKTKDRRKAEKGEKGESKN